MLENNNAVLAVVDPVYPGTALRPGSSGSEVARMQTYLNGLRDAKYPTLNRLVVDGRYGSATASTVMQYQVINRLSMDGVIGHDTWNAIVSDYNATIGGSADTYPGIPLRPGDRSQDVRHMQGRLNEVARIYTGINTQTVDGAYGNNMTNAVRRFQRQFSQFQAIPLSRRFPARPATVFACSMELITDSSTHSITARNTKSMSSSYKMEIVSGRPAL